MTLKETCSCGAILEVEGDTVSTQYRQKDFQKAHENCRQVKPGIIEKLEEIRCCIIDVENETRLRNCA